MSTPLPGVLGTLAPVLNRYGYLAIATAITAEGIGIPSFGETILIAGSVYAGTGRLNIVAVCAIALAAAIMGDNGGYLIGRLGGWLILRRFGRYVFLTGKRLDKIEEYFSHHGGFAVAIARFFEGLRQANGILAGATGMPWRRFLVYNASGAVIWVGIWASLGYVAGKNVGPVYREASKYSLYVLILLIAGVLAVVARHLIRSRRAAIAEAAASSPPATARTGSQDADTPEPLNRPEPAAQPPTARD
jgi:membrane protein DedA with SNARE-associated domain